MLDSHPQLTVANDTHFITRAAKKELRRKADPILTNDLVIKVRDYRRFRGMGLNATDVEKAAQGCRTYSAFVSKLYDIRAEHMGKLLSGEKTPDFCRQIPALNRLFPRAKIVHIIRDGRDTALSAMNWATSTKGPGKWSLWAEDPVGTCALWWRWQTGTGMRDGRAQDEGIYYQISYERLVEDPSAELSAIAAFLRIPDADEMSNFFDGKTKANPNLSAKSAWLPPTKGLREWRNQMDEEDVAVFEGITNTLLKQLGYELAGTKVTARIEDRIQRCMGWWQQQKTSRT